MIVMLISAAILGRGAATEDLHMRSVLLDTLADALAATGVAITGTIILITGKVIAAAAARLLGHVTAALRHHPPLEIDDDD